MAKKGHDSRAIANIFVEKSQENGNWLTIMQLVKLVYIAHGWTLGYTGDPLIRHKVQAWRYGPVVPEVYKTFRLQGTLIRSRAENIMGNFYQADLSEEEEEIVDGVYDKYSILSPFALSDITHREGTPWSKYSGKNYQTIPNEEIQAYYEKVVDRMKERENDKGN